MNFKNKQKTEQKQTAEVPSAKVVTETQLKEHQKNLQDQLAEAQTKMVMLQGAIQMVDLQIRELDNPGDESPKSKNGVN